MEQKNLDCQKLLTTYSVGCIGTSKPNTKEYADCVAIGYSLVFMNKTVVSGNAEGCDYAYASGANILFPNRVKLILPNSNHNLKHIISGNDVVTQHDPEWAVIARQNHPKYDYLSLYVKKLMDRNAGIILNSDLVIALPNYRNKSWGGGTSHGMRIAKSLGKPVFDISNEQMREELLDYLRAIVGKTK